MNINGIPIPDYALYGLSAIVVVFLANLLLKGKGMTDTRKLVTYAGGGLLIVLAVLSYGGILPLGGAALAVGQVGVAQPTTQADLNAAILAAQAGQVSVTWTFEIENSANTTLTAKEYLAGNISVYDKATGENLKTVRVEATADGGSWTGAQIGKTYVYKLVSVDNVINSFVGEKTIMQKSEKTTLAVPQAGTLTFRVYDEGMISKNLMYDSGDAETVTYEASGTTFESVTDNATATAIGTGSNFVATFEVKPTNSDNQFGDEALYLAIKAATTSWKPADAVITINGVSATRITQDVPAQLISDGYQELFLLPVKGITGGSPTKVYVSVPPKDGGTNPSADITVGFVSKGSYLLGNAMHDGIVKADGSTYVHTIQTAIVDLS